MSILKHTICKSTKQNIEKLNNLALFSFFGLFKMFYGYSIWFLKLGPYSMQCFMPVKNNCMK